MKQFGFWVFVLILAFLVLLYFKGFTSDVTSGGGVLGNLINTLQGRNAQGNITQYPSGGGTIA